MARCKLSFAYCDRGMFTFESLLTRLNNLRAALFLAFRFLDLRLHITLLDTSPVQFALFVPRSAPA